MKLVHFQYKIVDQSLFHFTFVLIAGIDLDILYRSIFIE